MIKALVDTTVVIHLYRRYQPARNWYAMQTIPLAITSVTWMEIIYGAGSKAKQNTSRTILAAFNLIYLTAIDQQWAMTQLTNLRLSHGVSINDCWIASASHRLQVPLYTHNLKDMTPMLGDLAIKPYH